jgi:hypothetical protein
VDTFDKEYTKARDRRKTSKPREKNKNKIGKIFHNSASGDKTIRKNTQERYGHSVYKIRERSVG